MVGISTGRSGELVLPRAGSEDKYALESVTSQLELRYRLHLIIFKVCVMHGINSAFHAIKIANHEIRANNSCCFKCQNLDMFRFFVQIGTRVFYIFYIARFNRTKGIKRLKCLLHEK